MDLGALDRHITGNFGEDQYPICPCGDEDCDGEHEDDRDFDDLEDDDDFPLYMEYDEGGWDE